LLHQLRRWPPPVMGQAAWPHVAWYWPAAASA
jgi:hypothetical protein